MSKITMRLYAGVGLGLLLAGVGGSASAPAHAGSYVGTWAASASQCKLLQDVEDAPLVMKSNRYDRHEAHCAFGRVSHTGTKWHTRATCDIEGDKQKRGLTLSVRGSRLTINYSDGGSESYQRCP
jgi:hypothetical protein